MVRFIKEGEKPAQQILEIIKKEPKKFTNKSVAVKKDIALRIIEEGTQSGVMEKGILKDGNTLFKICLNDADFTCVDMIKTKKKLPERPHSTYLIIKASSETFKLRVLSNVGVYHDEQRVYVTYKKPDRIDNKQMLESKEQSEN